MPGLPQACERLESRRAGHGLDMPASPTQAPDPAAFPRRILLGLVGLTPQVVTETLYALAVQRHPPFVPTEIHLATTEEGRNRAELTLLDPDCGMLAAFARDYALPGLVRALTRDRIHVITDAEGAVLSDIAGPRDSAAAADFLVALVRRLTADEGAALHVSIAGGRKTMSFFLGYALSLFGRAQDRLSHVLVPEPFQSHPSFFYPPPEPRTLFLANAAPVRTDAARISLTDIPLVRLRHGLPAPLLEGRHSYSETVRGAQAHFAPPLLEIDRAGRRLTAQGRAIALPPILFAWVVWLAERRLADLPHKGALHWSEADAGAFVAVYEEIFGADGAGAERLRAALADGMTKQYFEEKKSRVNQILRRALGAAAAPYLLAPVGRRPLTRFGFTLPREAVRFVDRPAGGRP